MKTASTSLFKLIKAMSPNEKRYFMRNAALYGNKQSLRLYKAIEGQEQYDEPKIKKQFSADSYLGKGLGVAKLSLQDSLLKSLRNYNDSGNLNYIFTNMVKDVDILYNKGLYDMCHKLIVKLKAMAVQHENWVWLCEVIQYERRVMNSKGFNPSAYKQLELIIKEQREALQKLENYYEVRSIYDSFNFFLKSEGVRNKDLKQLEKLYSHPLLKSKKNILSKKAEVLYHEIKIYYYVYVKNNLELAREHTVMQVDLTKQMLQQTDESVRAYLSALKLHVTACILSHRWNDALKGCAEMKEFIKRPMSFNSIKLAFVDASINELEIYNKIGNFRQTVASATTIDSMMKEYAAYFNNGYYIVTYFNLAFGFFGAGNYREALKWHNKLLNETDITIRPDVHCLARIMNLLIHYELGNQELLEYIIRSTYRFLYQRKRLYRFEDTLLNFIRKDLLSVKTQKELIQAFKLLHGRLQQIIKNPFEEQAIAEFDIVSWLESKIENRSFAEILKDKE